MNFGRVQFSLHNAAPVRGQDVHIPPINVLNLNPNIMRVGDKFFRYMGS